MSELSGLDLDTALEAALRKRYPLADASGLWLTRAIAGFDALRAVARREGYGVELCWPPEAIKDGCEAKLWRKGECWCARGDCAGEALARALLAVWAEDEGK